MAGDFTYDVLFQVCQEVEGKQIKAKEKKIDYQHCEKCNVKRMMYPHLGFYVWPSCGVCRDDICVIGYNESTVMQKKMKGIKKEINIFNQKLESSYAENLLRFLIV